jgi:hypothetical protein
LGLVLTLGVLAPASGQAAAVAVPHAATHTVTPQVATSPSPPPSAAPAPSAAPTPSPAPAAPPSSSTLNMSGGQGFSPSQANIPAPSGPSAGLDVGHQAGQQDWESAYEYDDPFSGAPLTGLALQEDVLQDDIAQLRAGFPPFNQSLLDLNQVSEAWFLALDEALLTHVWQAQQRQQLLQQPEVAVRMITGYGEVTDAPCHADFWSLNDDVGDDPNNGVARC